MVVVMLMVLVVNILLLFAAGRFLGQQGNVLRILLAAGFGTGFVLVSMLPDFSFLEKVPWRLCCYGLSAWIAFGFSKTTISKWILYSLLHLALEGITAGESAGLPTLFGAAGIGFAYLATGKRQMLIPVELTYGGITHRLTALRDTGHSLRDPITGKSVLVVDADTACKMTGLTIGELSAPLQSLSTIPGLRLIPYKTVGNTGFLLAIQIREAKIGNRQGSALVAFSPNGLGKHYQALTGGIL